MPYCGKHFWNPYMLIFLSKYWWKKSDIWSQASYRYPISWEVFFDPSDSCLPKSGGIIGEISSQFILLLMCPSGTCLPMEFCFSELNL
jgi:hypothetical protein